MMAVRNWDSETLEPRDGLARPRRGAVVDVGIWDLVQWAFQVEGASLNFDEVGVRRNVGIEWILIEQARLGCRPDGGGRSDPHPDADIVAAALTVLPEAYGGAGMAITIAEGARTGRVPDCMAGAVARCAPRGWRRHKTGTYAEREYWTGPGRWPSTWLSDKYGYVCPVTYTGTAVEIGRARRTYLQWWSALLELRHCLLIGRSLSAFQLTDAMPPREPWKENA
jgi:hypothetical protein